MRKAPPGGGKDCQCHIAQHLSNTRTQYTKSSIDYLKSYQPCQTGQDGQRPGGVRNGKINKPGRASGDNRWIQVKDALYREEDREEERRHDEWTDKVELWVAAINSEELDKVDGGLQLRFLVLRRRHELSRAFELATDTRESRRVELEREIEWPEECTEAQRRDDNCAPPWQTNRFVNGVKALLDEANVRPFRVQRRWMQGVRGMLHGQRGSNRGTSSGNSRPSNRRCHCSGGDSSDGACWLAVSRIENGIEMPTGGERQWFRVAWAEESGTAARPRGGGGEAPTRHAPRSSGSGNSHRCQASSLDQGRHDF